jgi:hypothetical protein
MALTSILPRRQLFTREENRKIILALALATAHHKNLRRME